jgi:serine/threonine-protein kinase
MAALVLAFRRAPAPPAAVLPPAAEPLRLGLRPAMGRLVVQARAAATLVLDGRAQAPPLAAGELRVVEVLPGDHRIELTTTDGRRAAATMQVRPGETAELLGVALE